jgi:oligosaccharide repeat unit polymerase
MSGHGARPGVAAAQEIDFRKSHRVLAHPLTLFLSAWVFVVALYAMHLSALLRFDNGQLFSNVGYIVAPFILACLIAWMLFSNADASRPIVVDHVGVAKISELLHNWFIVWCLITIVEILYSGGLPILWLLRGSSKTYVDFGIPSVHGLANSMLLAVGLGSMSLYAITRDKRYVRLPMFVFAWSMMAVTRNMMMVFAIEAAVSWEIFRGFRRRNLVAAAAAFAALILVFGYIGDMRTGADKFRKLAQPSADYPDWMPSGVLWGYVYMTTPINNLINTEIQSRPLYNLKFPNTTSLLFPKVIRAEIFGKDALEESNHGNLVAEAFTVSTAYVGPYQDYGAAGIAAFSVLLGVCSVYWWHQHSLFGMLSYVVIAQCVLVSVFFNHLFYLPVITQLVWLYWIAGSNKRVKSVKRLRPAVAGSPVRSKAG